MPSRLLRTAMDEAILYACKHSWRLYSRANFTVRRRCGQRLLKVPIVRGCGLGFRDFRDEQIQVIVRRLHANGRRGYFVDVGANLGVMLLNLLETSLGIPYVAFEPDLTAALYISDLIRQNDLPDHHVFPVALGAQHGAAILHFGPVADVSGTLSLGLRPTQMYSHVRMVPVSTADSLLQTFTDLFLVKIDVEGLESDVLTGMQQTLKARLPPVYFEVMGYGHLLNRTYSREYFGELSDTEIDRLVKNRRNNMRRLETFFSRFGYHLLRCRTGGNAPESVETLDPGPDKDSGEMNFLALADQDRVAVESGQS